MHSTMRPSGVWRHRLSRWQSTSLIVRSTKTSQRHRSTSEVVGKRRKRDGRRSHSHQRQVRAGRQKVNVANVAKKFASVIGMERRCRPGRLRQFWTPSGGPEHVRVCHRSDVVPVGTVRSHCRLDMSLSPAEIASEWPRFESQFEYNWRWSTSFKFWKSLPITSRTIRENHFSGRIPRLQSIHSWSVPETSGYERDCWMWGGEQQQRSRRRDLSVHPLHLVRRLLLDVGGDDHVLFVG